MVVIMRLESELHIRLMHAWKNNYALVEVFSHIQAQFWDKNR